MPEIENNLDEFTNQCFATGNQLDCWSMSSSLLLKQLNLCFFFVFVFDFLLFIFQMQNIFLRVSKHF